jgi:hypothetical protein
LNCKKFSKFFLQNGGMAAARSYLPPSFRPFFAIFVFFVTLPNRVIPSASRHSEQSEESPAITTELLGALWWEVPHFVRNDGSGVRNGGSGVRNGGSGAALIFTEGGDCFGELVRKLKIIMYICTTIVLRQIFRL